ncbi:MAG TPA: flagellar hook-associated protein FlgK, partial [Firmicutes bacterium]|nr:flagellar hook-associated protein FlgK [Bacillota bacterium]
MSMRTTFSGLSIALRALQTQQISLDITGHNVANVNNPNYSRQTALHAATKPYPAPMMGYTPSSGQLGTGVQISQINRMRDGFVDLRLRQQLHSKHYWATMEEGLRQVELFFNEPTENGIHYALDQFWDSLQDLSREPDFAAVREVVVQRAQVLVESITGTRSHLQSLRENINGNIPLKVDEVNSLARRIADLNVQIGKISATGSLPNDLLDARDAMVEELSQLVDIEVVQDHAHMIGVTIGGASLVHRGTSYGLTTTAGEPIPGENYKRVDIIWSATGNGVNITSGEIGGLKKLREDITGIMGRLDEWTLDFALEFNRRHAVGYDASGRGGYTGELDSDVPENEGIPDFPFHFFTFENHPYDADDPAHPLDEQLPFAALNIRVNEKIVDNANLIRAGLQEAVGNGENALRLANLRFDPIERLTKKNTNTGDQKVTIGDAFNSIIAELGVRTQQAVRMNENGTNLELHLRNLKDSISGVSLDEEMANMIRFQHAYSAAARVMTTMDEALDTIINRLGMVGR